MNHPVSPLHTDADARLPAAAYLRYETRADGWSAGRQAAFLSHLADHGVVEDAAACVGKHVSGAYALRRTARGYAFNLAWEAALIIARRIVADRLMSAAIKGEQACWVREENRTTYTRQNTKLSLALLDRVNPAMTLPEVMAVATRFDWFLELIDKGAGARDMWELFFEDALPHDEGEARERVRASLLLTEESADFEEGLEDGSEDDGAAPSDDRPIEYKSMDGPPDRQRIHALHHGAPRDRLSKTRRYSRVTFGSCLVSNGTNHLHPRLTDMTRKTKSPNWFGISMDAWALAAESNMVIAMRMGQMAFGGPAAAIEAERMVSEKVAAGMALGFDLMSGKHGSTPEQVMSGSIAHYSRRVRSNRRRLGK